MNLPVAFLLVSLLVTVFCLGSGSPGAVADEPEAKPVELGAVAWHRAFGEASKIATGAKQALLVVFQEVPG